MTKRSSNFAFLSRYPEANGPALAKRAAEAEKLLPDYPLQSAATTRLFSEELARAIAATTTDKPLQKASADQSERINKLFKSGYIDDETYKLFNRIRAAGNDAVHGAKIDVVDAAKQLKDAYDLATWFVRTHLGHCDYQPSPFVLHNEGLAAVVERLGGKVRTTTDTGASYQERQLSPPVVMSDGLSARDLLPDSRTRSSEPAVVSAHQGLPASGPLRVYELAKELGVEKKDLVSKIRSLGIDVRSHLSRLDEDDAVYIRRALDRERQANEVEEQITATVIRRHRKGSAPVADGPRRPDAASPVHSIGSDELAELPKGLPPARDFEQTNLAVPGIAGLEETDEDLEAAEKAVALFDSNNHSGRNIESWPEDSVGRAEDDNENEERNEDYDASHDPQDPYLQKTGLERCHYCGAVGMDVGIHEGLPHPACPRCASIDWKKHLSNTFRG